MPKNLLLEVLDRQHMPGLRALRPIKKRVELAPGKYTVRVRRWGVGDPVIVGNSDGISFGLKVGPKVLVAASGKIASARRVDVQVSAEPQPLVVADGDELGLAMALVQDRGEAPAALNTLVKKVLGYLPETDKKALLALLLASGVNAAFGAAAASVLFAKLAGTVIDSIFGDHDLLKVERRALVGAADGARGCTLCFAQLPDFSGINAGYRPKYRADYGVRADDMMLYETVRSRAFYPESHTFPRWTRCTEAYVVVDIEWVG